MIRKHLMVFLEEHEIIGERQFGFMDRRPTTLQLLRVMDEWTTALDNGNEVDVICEDFQRLLTWFPIEDFSASLSRMEFAVKH